MASLALIAGDTEPTRLIYRDAKTQAPIDLTGYSISIRIDYGTPLTKAAVLDSETTGAFDFEWLSTDLVAGTWPARIIVIDDTTKKKTHKIGSIVIEA